MSASTRSDSQAFGRVVVLGGLGFMGSHICRELLARGYPVRIFDRLYALRTLVEDIEDALEIVEGDMALTDDVMNVISEADTVIHLVHTTVPGSSMKDPAYDLSSNVVASVGWLSRLHETKVRRLIYVSSGGTVYGPPQTNPIKENHPTEPISSYGITKLTIEKYVAMYAAMFGIDYCVVRPSNVYGPGQKLHIGQGVIGVLTDRALRGEPLEVWGTGESLRDYLHVEDLVQAISGLVAYTGPQRVFNISSGVGHSVLDIIRILNGCLGFVPALLYKPDRGFDVPVNVLDSSRLHAETGWRPAIGLEDGIARTVEWLRRLQKHEAGAA
ncbi:MAG TPA: NAD-dependent epimerase/dehydratase family protein [Pyrinomonadaceae bacterium]